MTPGWTRAIGAVWLAAGTALVVAGLVVLGDRLALGWELPLGALVAAVGWWLWHRRVVVDEHGLEQTVGWRRSRVLWSAVEWVEVDTASFVGAVRVGVRGRDAVVLAGAWGSTRPQRRRLLEVVADAAERFPVDVRAAT